MNESEEAVLAALRANRRRSPVELAELLDTLAPQGLSDAMLVFCFKRAFPQSPMNLAARRSCGAGRRAHGMPAAGRSSGAESRCRQSRTRRRGARRVDLLLRPVGEAAASLGVSVSAVIRARQHGVRVLTDAGIAAEALLRRAGASI